jgi:hypothetical protein
MVIALPGAPSNSVTMRWTASIILLVSQYADPA